MDINQYDISDIILVPHFDNIYEQKEKRGKIIEKMRPFYTTGNSIGNPDHD